MSVEAYLQSAHSEQDKREALARALSGTKALAKRDEVNAQRYRNVEEYDLVLRAHCRLKESGERPSG